jgi:hypothetical protein
MSEDVRIRLKDGTELWSTCLIVSSSDRGATLFTPSERATRNFIAKARADAKRLFGEKPIILVPPRVTLDAQGQPWLPHVRFVGEFSSAATDEAFDLSTAVVIWYQQRTFPFIGDDVVDDFTSIDWKIHAENERLL